MKLTTWVQLLERLKFISLPPIIYRKADWVFSLGMATSLRQGKLWIQTSEFKTLNSNCLKIDLVSHLACSVRVEQIQRPLLSPLNSSTFRTHGIMYTLQESSQPLCWDCRIHWTHICRGVKPSPQWVSWVWWNFSDGEAPVLELKELEYPIIAITPRSTLLATDMVLSMSQIDI